VGYIPDMIFDRELDYMAETGAEGWTSPRTRSRPVQPPAPPGGPWASSTTSPCPRTPPSAASCPDLFSLTRTFHLIRHADDRRVERLNRFAEALAEGVRREVQRLESIA
jgi:hypothetical protein